MAVLSLVLLVVLLKALVSDAKSTDNGSFGYRRIRILSALVLGLILLPILTVNWIQYEPSLESRKEALVYYDKYSLHLDRNWTYRQMLMEQPDSMALHYEYVSSISDYITEQESNYDFDLLRFKESRASVSLIEFYEKELTSRNSEVKDRAKLFLALHYLDRKEEAKAREYLEKIENDANPYYSFVQAKVYSRTSHNKEYQLAVKGFEKSISDSISLQDSYLELGTLYYRYGERDDLERLINNMEAVPHLGVFLKRIAYMRSLRFHDYWKVIVMEKLLSISLIGFCSALLILMLWLFYLRQVDVFEQERWSYLLATLAMSMCTIFLVYPIHDVLWDIFNFYPSKNSFGEFIYITISVGMVEEFVKLIPVLILLKWTKAINEPFDYILYCSVSALGFAFVENLGYLQQDSLYNINARALFATVAHLIFSSTIGYGLMLVKYRDFGNKWVVLLSFFSIAAAMHGFYDFWLMNDAVRSFKWVTMLFLLASVHIWYIYANNTMNISTFYNKRVVVRNDRLKIYLILGLLTILMVSYVVNASTRGVSYGNIQLLRAYFFYGFIIFYLALSLSRFVVVRGYLAPIAIPLTFLIPKLSRRTDFSGLPVKILRPKGMSFFEEFKSVQLALPIEGVLKKQIVIENSLEAYVVTLNTTIACERHVMDRIVILPKAENRKLIEERNILVYFLLIPDDLSLDAPNLKVTDFSFAGWALSRKLGRNALSISKPESL